MRVNQILRINLEMDFGNRVDIGCRSDPIDPFIVTQQDAAALAGMGCVCFAPDACNHFACHFDVHRACP